MNDWTRATTTEVQHRRGCPGLQAWDIPEACKCDAPRVTRCNRCGRRLKRYATECSRCPLENQ